MRSFLFVFKDIETMQGFPRCPECGFSVRQGIGSAWSVCHLLVGGVTVRGHRPETGSKVIVHVFLAKGGQDSARRTNENVLGLLLALGQGSVALKVWAAAHRRQHHAVP